VNLKQTLNPRDFKSVTQAPASLRKVQVKLKDFRDESRLKHQENYVPVTMDELMARFELNLEREKYLDAHNESKELLEQKSLM